MNGVFSYLDCSTAHITEEADNYLQFLQNYPAELPTRLLLYTEASSWHEGGYWIYADLDGQTAEEMDLPQCIYDVCMYATAKDCMWVRLSADGTVFTDLTTHTW